MEIAAALLHLGGSKTPGSSILHCLYRGHLCVCLDEATTSSIPMLRDANDVVQASASGAVADRLLDEGYNQLVGTRMPLSSVSMKK